MTEHIPEKVKPSWKADLVFILILTKLTFAVRKLKPSWKADLVFILILAKLTFAVRKFAVNHIKHSVAS